MEKCWCVWWSNGALLLLPLKLPQGICYGHELTPLSCGWTRVFASSSSWSTELISHAMMCHQACCPDLWHPRLTSSEHSMEGTAEIPTWPLMACDTAVSVPWHRLALVCWDSLVWSGFLVSVHLSGSCSGMHESDEISGDVSKAQLLLSVSWSLLWHKDCVLLCPALPLLLPHKPRDVLAPCSVQKLFHALLGFLLSCGSCFSSNPHTKDTAMLRQSGQKRHDIFYGSRTIYLHFLGTSWCAECPDANSLTPTAHSNIVKTAQSTTVTWALQL